MSNPKNPSDALQTLIDESGCMTIGGWCALLRISRAHYFAMRRRGQGPVELRYGRKVLITVEAARAFLRGEG